MKEKLDSESRAAIVNYRLERAYETLKEADYNTAGGYYNATLSKILCKWKQDSVISFSLYLDSVFKYKHKLVHNQSPV